MAFALFLLEPRGHHVVINRPPARLRARLKPALPTYAVAALRREIPATRHAYPVIHDTLPSAPLPPANVQLSDYTPDSQYVKPICVLPVVAQQFPIGRRARFALRTPALVSIRVHPPRPATFSASRQEDIWRWVPAWGLDPLALYAPCIVAIHACHPLLSSS